MGNSADELQLFEFEASGAIGGEGNTEEEIDTTMIRALSKVACQLNRAESRFETTVVRARRSGLSWRRIANATGVPFQTLHRRAGRPLDRNQPGRRIRAR